MAVEESSTEPDEDDRVRPGIGKSPAENSPTGVEEETEEEDEEEEPHLKYATLTKNLSSLYRNGDASSSFFVAGDKMIVGTHNGNIHVLSLPTFQSVKVYHAHSASISAISISPFPPPLPIFKLDAAHRLASESATDTEKTGSSSPGAKGSPRQGPVPNTPSNQIYIATSSIDGNVCIASLVDPKDVQLRNFGRPVQAVALSPEYRSDRNFLSGGQAGSLILTTGGQAGRSANATTTGATAAASGWLGSIGLGANTGTDKVLHSGEGIISNIKWSRSGKYVLWVNEHGIKIMRSNLQLESADSGLEWKRMNHIDRPSRPGWEDMAGVWKARAEWIDRDTLESDDGSLDRRTPANGGGLDSAKTTKPRENVEEVVIGWGDTAWIIKVYPGANTAGKDSGERKAGRAEVATIIRFDDCTISGISLYTPDLLLVLAHMESKEDNGVKNSSDGSARKGRQHRHNALEPELRLIDINTKEEVDTDTLTVSRYESLSASDYHLGVLPPRRLPASLAQGSYLGAIGSGINTIGSGVGAVGSGLYTGAEIVGQGMWDATMYPTRMLGANRLFAGGDSIRSGKASGEKLGSAKGTNYLTGWIPVFGSGKENEQLNDVTTTQGMKIFVYSPYDCIVAVKRNLADRLQWLTKMERYEQAWALLDEHPEAAGPTSETSGASSPPTPSKSSSIARSSSIGSPGPANTRQHATLADFFADSSSVTSSTKLKNQNSSAEKEKRRIGELWLQQLTSAKQWKEAGDVAGKVLNTSTRWEHWIWTFVRNKKFDEISPVVPTYQITPPLPSLVFEIILGHYVSADRLRFKELLDLWPSDLFEIGTISNAIEDQLQSGTAAKESTDWRLLQECLAKLNLADGRYKEALHCYVKLQDADTAMSLIKDHHLVDAIADDVPGLVLLRISSEQIRLGARDELEELSSEPIKLLVDEATQGTVEPERVVTQLEEASLFVFLYFYLRALWRGEGTTQTPTAPRVGHMAAVQSLAADEGKFLVEQFADTAVDLFAEYDRELLLEFLHTSSAYTFEAAVKVCEKRQFVPELVYLLSKTGQMKTALFLIIEKLDDVSKAISFAKEQDDKGLWDDLLEYSMSKPRFISALLSEVGTTIDPIRLIKRIPSGLEIEGLRGGLKKMIREYDLQYSISQGAAKVMSSEVGVRMDILRKGRRKGIKFDVTAGSKKTRSRGLDRPTSPPGSRPGDEKTASLAEITEPGHCAGCGHAFPDGETQTIIGFACGHVYHVSHLLNDPAVEDGAFEERQDLADTDDVGYPTTFTRTVGPKVTHARLLKDKVEAIGGCRVCKAHRLEVEDV